MKKILFLLLLTAFTTFLKAQNRTLQSSVQPFLFSVNTLTETSPHWNLNYSPGYGKRASGPFGYDGVDQRFAIKGYIGNRFTLFANAEMGFARGGGVHSAQQAEVIRDFIGGKKQIGAKFGVGLGLNRDWNGTGAVFSRLTAGWEAAKWRFGGNMIFEKAFSSTRDKIDLTTSMGFQHHIAGSFYGGLEAVGQDLEGFWDPEESEGGAMMLIGPSINIAPSGSKFAFSLCGGPVFYATRSNVLPSEAIRDLSTQNGYSLRAMMSFNFHK